MDGGLRSFHERVRRCWCGAMPEPMDCVSALPRKKGAKIYGIYCRHGGRWAMSMTRACTTMAEAIVVWNRTHGYDAEIATP